MKEKYLINESVYFYPAKQLLAPVSGEEESVSLNVPASRCLKLLLEKKGEIVTRYDFSQEVWESRGQYTSTNTLYQNISLIRKALRAVGISQDVIHTIPREGFSFLGTAILIQEENDVTDNQLVSEPVQKELTSSEVSVTYNTDVINHVYPVQGSYVHKNNKFTENNCPTKPEIGPRFGLIACNCIDVIYRYKSRSFFACLLLALLIAIPYYYGFSEDRHDFFSNYQEIGVINKCTLMKSENDKLRQKEDYLSFFKEKDIHCESEKNVYIAMDTRATKIFMHICDKNTDDTSSCFSTFFIER
ncbi:winged helix-turn-helix domain-containing protein [Klebsiella michiganensis]|nr:winged helix-turn-helix domain-containing protein [Klebsiella michiganensis]HCZ9102610.1 winged helix-turn-helix domain-containing protein [Klebsiella michiganensis]